MGYRRFQIGFVFAEYDLFKPTIFIQNLVYTDFNKFSLYSPFNHCQPDPFAFIVQLVTIKRFIPCNVHGRNS